MLRHILRKTDPTSPLRYPGGKALLSPYISGVVEENFLSGCTIYEPYAGGAAVSLELIRLGFVSEAVLVEKDPLIYSFWHCVFNETAELCKAINSCEITIEKWGDFQPLRDINDINQTNFSILEMGLAGIFFNRTNFSGILAAGPIGGKSQNSKYKIDCRFNKVRIIETINYLSTFKDRVEVHCEDAITFLKENTERISTGFSFVYIDPPYYTQGKKLYRHSYSDDDHKDLASYIRRQAYPWVISYDDHPRIRELYCDNQVQPIYLDYKVKSNRTAQELLISNLVIPPPVYETTIEVDSALIKTA